MKKYLKKIKLIYDEKKVIKELLDNKNTLLKQCIFLNTHSYVETLKNIDFMKSILASKYIFVDGVGISLASKIFFKNLDINRITGYDFFEKLLTNINNLKLEKKLFFIGGEIDNLKNLKKKNT